jgi:hypothetical protein
VLLLWRRICNREKESGDRVACRSADAGRLCPCRKVAAPLVIPCRACGELGGRLEANPFGARISSSGDHAGRPHPAGKAMSAAARQAAASGGHCATAWGLEGDGAEPVRCVTRRLRRPRQVAVRRGEGSECRSARAAASGGRCAAWASCRRTTSCRSGGWSTPAAVVSAGSSCNQMNQGEFDLLLA